MTHWQHDPNGQQQIPPAAQYPYQPPVQHPYPTHPGMPPVPEGYPSPHHYPPEGYPQQVPPYPPLEYEEAPPFVVSCLSSVFTIVIELLALVLLVLFLIRLFVLERYNVDGTSMLPTLEDGQELFVNSAAYLLSEPERGDIIVLIPPEDPGKYYVKRIIGLPGETIELKGQGDAQVIVYNEEYGNGIRLEEPYIKKADPDAEVLLPVPGKSASSSRSVVQGYDYSLKEKLLTDEYFVMGDNRTGSSDSRGNPNDIYSVWHLPKKNIEGKVLLVMENVHRRRPTDAALTTQVLNERTWFSVGALRVPKIRLVSNPEYNL